MRNSGHFIPNEKLTFLMEFKIMEELLLLLLSMVFLMSNLYMEQIMETVGINTFQC